MLDGRRHRLGGLDSADGRLNRRIEVLHAQTGAIDADGSEQARPLLAQMARIELDRVLGIRPDVEETVEVADDRLEGLGGEQVGRAAAPMDMRHRPPADPRRDHGDFRPEHLDVGLDRRIAPRRLGGAAAVVADGVAERDVDVERDGAVLRRCPVEKAAIGVRADVGREVRRRRIGGVARYGGANEGFEGNGFVQLCHAQS